LSIYGSVISSNTSQSEGAGIAVYGGTIDTIEDSLIENNATTVGSGGGISVDADPQTGTPGSIGVIEQSGIVNNSAPSGGGVSLLNGSIGEAQVSGIDWCTIAYNHATDGYGGGVYFVPGPFEFNALFAKHDTVADNTATATAGGGGVYAQQGGRVAWDGSIFAYNTSHNGAADDYEGQLRQPGFECWTDGLDPNQIRTLSKPPPIGWRTSSASGCNPANTLVNDQNTSPSFSSNSLSSSTGGWPGGTPSLPYFPMSSNPAKGQTYFYQAFPNERDELNQPAAHTGSNGYYVIGAIEKK
jgi:hypothetical protein